MQCSAQLYSWFFLKQKTKNNQKTKKYSVPCLLSMLTVIPLTEFLGTWMERIVLFYSRLCRHRSLCWSMSCIWTETSTKLPWQRSKRVAASTHRYTLAAGVCRANGKGSMHTLLIDLGAVVALKPFVAPNERPCWAAVWSEQKNASAWSFKKCSWYMAFELRKWKRIKNGDVQSLQSNRILCRACHLCW